VEKRVGKDSRGGLLPLSNKIRVNAELRSNLVNGLVSSNSFQSDFSFEFSAVAVSLLLHLSCLRRKRGRQVYDSFPVNSNRSDSTLTTCPVFGGNYKPVRSLG